VKQIIELDECSAKDIIEKISKLIEVPLEKDGLDYCFEYPENQGRGYFRAISFSYGVSVLEFIVDPNKDIRLVFDNCDTNGLMLGFNIEDDLSIIESTKNSPVNIEKLNCCFFSSGVSKHYSLELQRNSTNNMFIIIINRKEFESKLSHLDCDFDDYNRKIFMDLNGINNFMNLDYFSLEIGKLVEEFRHCDVDNFMKPIFLESKAYEILTFHLQYINKRNNPNGLNNSLRKDTIDKIEKAVEIIETNLDQRINVHSLANKVGLNKNTLQNGFKSLYKLSVNSYIKNKRLEMAKVLIEDSDLNLTEITYKVGINSRSYFSKLFKEKYGVSPSVYISQKKSDEMKLA